MANKVPWFITFDWKNIIGILAVISTLILVLSFLFFPSLVKSTKLSSYKGEAIGIVTNVKENTEINQGRQGTRLYIGSFTISYYYIVDKETYTSKESIKASPKSGKAIEKNISSESKQIQVMYDKSDPSKSLILLDNNLQ